MCNEFGALFVMLALAGCSGATPAPHRTTGTSEPELANTKPAAGPASCRVAGYHLPFEELAAQYHHRDSAEPAVGLVVEAIELSPSPDWVGGFSWRFQDEAKRRAKATMDRTKVTAGDVVVKCNAYSHTDEFRSGVCTYRDKRDPSGKHDRLQTFVKSNYEQEWYDRSWPYFEASKGRLDDVVRGVIHQLFQPAGNKKAPSQETIEKRLREVVTMRLSAQGLKADLSDRRWNLVWKGPLSNYFIRPDGVYIAFVPGSVGLAPDAGTPIVRVRWDELAPSWLKAPKTDVPICEEPTVLADLKPLALAAAIPKPPKPATKIAGRGDGLPLFLAELIQWDFPRFFHWQRMEIGSTYGVGRVNQDALAFIDSERELAARTIDRSRMSPPTQTNTNRSDMAVFCGHTSFEAFDESESVWVSYKCEAIDHRTESKPRVKLKVWNGWAKGDDLEPVGFDDLFTRPKQARHVVAQRAAADPDVSNEVRRGELVLFENGKTEQITLDYTNLWIHVPKPRFGKTVTEDTVRGAEIIQIHWDLLRPLLKPRYRKLIDHFAKVRPHRH